MKMNAKAKEWLTMCGCGAICGVCIWVALSYWSTWDMKALVGSILGGIATGAIMQLMT